MEFRKVAAVSCFRRCGEIKATAKSAQKNKMVRREIHIHPDGRRRLSIYEAMLLQGFPENFVLKGNLSEQVEQVSNAVPPPLARCIAAAVKRAMQVDRKI